MYLEVILSLFVFMFSAYFIFHYLNMFCVEKQVFKFFAAHLVTRATHLVTLLRLTCDLFRDSLVVQRKSHNSLTTHSWLAKIFVTHFATYSIAKCPETAF